MATTLSAPLPIMRQLRSISILIILGFLAACEGLLTSPASELEGVYDARTVGNGLPVPAYYRQRLNRSSYHGGWLTLRPGMRYEHVELASNGEVMFRATGEFQLRGDTILAADAYGRPASFVAGPDGIVTDVFTNTVYVKRGSTPIPRFTYRTYQMVSYNGAPTPIITPDTRYILGYLWLWDDGRFNRFTDESAFDSRSSGTYTQSGDRLTFQVGTATEQGSAAGDRITIGPFVYQRVPNR